MLRVRALRARERCGAIFGDLSVQRPDLEGERARDRACRVHDRRGAATPRPRLGRDRRDPAPDRPVRGAAGVPDRLLGRLEEPQEPGYWRSLRDGCGALRRPGAAVLGRRLQGARRDVLGAAGVAAEPADAGLRAVDGEAARRRAPRLPLERRAAEARGLSALDVRALDPGLLRPADSMRPAGLRNEVAVGDRRATSGRATSPSTRSTPTTAPDGSTTPPSRRIPAAAASVTRSSRRRRPRATRGQAERERSGQEAPGPGDRPRRDADRAAGEAAPASFDPSCSARRATRSTQILGDDKHCAPER